MPKPCTTACRSKEFLLFETSFHTEGDLLQPRIREKYAPLLNVEMDAETISLAALADVTGAWTTTDENVLAASHDLHVWSDEFLEKRLKWRQTQVREIKKRPEASLRRGATARDLSLHDGPHSCING